jgi:hypothetical protein
MGGGSGAFIAKHEFCTDVCVVTKQSESPQNMSLGSNGVDRVSLLQKISTTSFHELVH